MQSVLDQIRRKLTSIGLYPRSNVGWVAFYSVALWIVLFLVQKIGYVRSGALQTAYNFTLLIAIGTHLILFYQWLKQRFMWRLRNRLIVTYIFIGVIPLVLVATMALLSAYLFAGQFSSFVVTSDIQAELKRISALNNDIATQLGARLRKNDGALSSDLVDSDNGQRQIVAFYRGKTTVLQKGAALTIPSLPAGFEEDPLAKELTTLVLDEDRIFLRSATRILTGTNGSEKLTVMSNIPLTSDRLESISSNIGIVKIYGRSQQANSRPKGTASYKVGDTYLDPSPKVTAGSVPPPANRLDVEFLPPGAFLSAYDWQTAKPTLLVMVVQTRPSMFYRRLFRALGDTAYVFVVVLAVVGVFFAVIELVALIIGVRLTRTMTGSIANLYDATQHVNRGDFSHRIRITSRDQLAALETSFNSMTESLEKLIAEQKEKQRIESELAIAQEVQALLFPRDITELEGLEVHGVCRPARTVSGDYYDFIQVSEHRLGVAVGDIAGKGISAALLMATVHAFVRSYALIEQVPATASMAAAYDGKSRSAVLDSPVALATHNGSLSPGTLLAMLNQQLYRSTPTEKYATMFLGFYDQNSREFAYSNAGHLPPLIVGADGSVRQLETGGTVVGLFGNMTYPDASVRMNPGDIFVAYSDGVTEPENEYGEFGVERLAQLVQENRNQSLARISDVVIGSVSDWIGPHEQPDDVTLVLARARQ